MRWQEEVTLTGYEMQWTVRYFLYMSRKWIIPVVNANEPASGAGAGIAHTGNPATLSTGANAYWKRKHAVWVDIVQKADGIFRTLNPAYQSPI